MNVLHVCASPKPTDESTSKQLSAAFFKKLTELNPDAEVVNVDLYQNPPPFMDHETFKAIWNPVTIEGYQSTADDEATMEYATAQAALFNKADIVVLSTPMWNYTVPAILKAWLEQTILPGKTYTPTVKGNTPLHQVKRAVLLVSSEETFKEDDPRDALTRQVQATFGSIGIRDFGIAWAEGQDSSRYSDSAQNKQFAFEAAEELAEEIAEMAAPATA